jgi:hypothetical protein
MTRRPTGRMLVRTRPWRHARDIEVGARLMTFLQDMIDEIKTILKQHGNGGATRRAVYTAEVVGL